MRLTSLQGIPQGYSPHNTSLVSVNPTPGKSVKHVSGSDKGNLDDLEDRYLAGARLEERQPALTGKHVREKLGLDN